MTKTHMCPVCGRSLSFSPWENDAPSDEISPHCGIHFGYDDMAGGDPAQRTEIYRKWREAWIRLGEVQIKPTGDGQFGLLHPAKRSIRRE